MRTLWVPTTYGPARCTRSGPEDGAVLVALHADSMASNSFEPLAKPLGHQNVGVISVDLPGYGCSLSDAPLTSDMHALAGAEKRAAAREADPDVAEATRLRLAGLTRQHGVAIVREVLTAGLPHGLDPPLRRNQHVSLVGRGRGARIALEYAALHGDSATGARVSALVLIDPPMPGEAVLGAVDVPVLVLWDQVC